MLCEKKMKLYMEKIITSSFDYYFGLVRNWYCVATLNNMFYNIIVWLRTNLIQSPLLLNEIIKTDTFL